jgi:phage-related protein
VAEQAYAYVTLIPVAKGFQQAVAKEMGGVNNVGSKAGSDAGKGFSGGFGKALAGIGGLIAGGLAAAGATNFLRESITAASDLNESLNAVSVSYGAATDGIVSLGESAANRLGLSTVAFNAIATQFSGFAANIAGPGGDVVGFIDELTTRGADFASVYNLDVDEALALFQSGLAGETEPLRKFGLDLSAATVESFAYANGIAAAGEPLTEAQKQQARYGALLEQTNKAQGDFANTSDGLANAQRILGANLDNVQATVGGPLLGAFAELTTALIPVVNELGPVLVGVMEQLSPIIAELAGQIPGLLTSLFPLLPVLGELAAVFLDLVAQLLPVFVELFAALMPTIVELVPIIAQFISEAMEVLVPILLQLVEALAPIIEALLPVFMELFEALAPVVLSLIEAMLPLIELLLPLFIDFIEFLTPILVFVAEIIGDILVFAIELLVDAITWVTENIGEFSTFFENVWNGIKSFFGDIINGLISGFEGFVNGAIRGINRVIDAINGLSFTIPDWVPVVGGETFGFDLKRLAEISLPRVELAEGGLVTGPTRALIGEAGPEMVIPLDRFESMLGEGGTGRTVNYYAAPNKSFDAEQELRLAMTRARVLA